MFDLGIKDVLGLFESMAVKDNVLIQLISAKQSVEFSLNQLLFSLLGAEEYSKVAVALKVVVNEKFHLLLDTETTEEWLRTQEWLNCSSIDDMAERLWDYFCAGPDEPEAAWLDEAQLAYEADCALSGCLDARELGGGLFGSNSLATAQGVTQPLRRNKDAILSPDYAPDLEPAAFADIGVCISSNLNYATKGKVS